MIIKANNIISIIPRPFHFLYFESLKTQKFHFLAVIAFFTCLALLTAVVLVIKYMNY